MHNDLWSWPISSRSFSHNFAIKLLKYVTSYVHSIAHTVLDGFFLYLAQMITSVRGCVVHNDLWSWPISSRSFSHDFAMKLMVPTDLEKCLNLTSVLKSGNFPWKLLFMGLTSNGPRNFMCLCTFQAFCTFDFNKLRGFDNFVIKSPITTYPVIGIKHG